jgi:hypothetical protein
MDYRDALEAAIDAIRAGATPQEAAAAYPEHAGRLLEDAALAAAVREYALVTSQPSEAAKERARQRLAGDLASLRAARYAAVQPATGSPKFAWGLPRLAFAAVVAVAALGLAALAAGIIGNPETASAETIDGVVVEKSEAKILLQTEEGLLTIDLVDGSPITDETGAALSPLALEPGQVIAVKAQRQAQGSVKALSVQRKPAASFAEWCRTHPIRCQEVEPRLPAGTIACRLNPAVCPAPAPPTPAAVTPVAAANPDRVRLQELSNRCQEAGGEACDELRRFCVANPVICAALAGWLRTVLELPDDLRDRVRLHTERCKDGSILDCRELRLICERLRDACPPPAPTPQRPLANATKPAVIATRAAQSTAMPPRQATPQQAPIVSTFPVQRPTR